MSKKTAIVAAIGVALPTLVLAEDPIASGDQMVDSYRWEVGTDIMGGDVDSITAGGTFYLSPVDPNKGPLAEAAFLNQSSSISAYYTDGETDGDGRGLEFKDYGIGSRFVIGDADWIIDLGYSRSEPDNPLNIGPDDFEIDTFTVGGGKYLTDNTTMVVSYTNKDADDGGDLDKYQLDLEHLFHTSWGGIKLLGSYGKVDLDDADDIDLYKLGGIFYPCKSIAIGASYRKADNDFLNEVEEYSAFAEWFINDQVGVTLEYRDADVEVDGGDDLEADAILVGARIRF